MMRRHHLTRTAGPGRPSKLTILGAEMLRQDGSLRPEAPPMLLDVPYVTLPHDTVMTS